MLIDRERLPSYADGARERAFPFVNIPKYYTNVTCSGHYAPLRD